MNYKHNVLVNNLKGSEELSFGVKQIPNVTVMVTSSHRKTISTKENNFSKAQKYFKRISDLAIRGIHYLTPVTQI